MATETFIVTNEADAWNILQRWLNKEEIGEVEFEGWPILSINIRGEDYKSSLNSSQMAALVEFKKIVSRSYSVVTHGSYDMRRLKLDEEEQLEFTTQVRPGSSLTDTDLTPLVQAFASAVTTHPTMSVIFGIVVALALVARPVILKHYETRAKQIDAEERARLMDLSLTAAERAHYSTFEKALKRLERVYPQLSRAIPEVSAGFWRFASASANADEMTVAGIKLTQSDLEILSERRQRRARDVSEVEQVFDIVGITKHQSAYRVQLASSNLTLTALYRWPQMTDAKVRRLMTFMAASKPVIAKLEIQVVDKAQVMGRLIRFKQYSE